MRNPYVRFALAVAAVLVASRTADAAPKAIVVNVPTQSAVYHPGVWVQLQSNGSTPSIPNGGLFTWDVTGFDPGVDASEYGHITGQVASANWTYSDPKQRNVTVFFPIGTTTVRLTVSDGSGSATATVVVNVLDDRYLSLVSYHRPWAAALPSLGESILADCDELVLAEPNNGKFLVARNAAEVAKTYEDYCQSLEFVYPDFAGLYGYDWLVTNYWLVCRTVQIQHHQGVVVNVTAGKGKSWSALETRAVATARDAVEDGLLDYQMGLAHSP